LDRVVLAVFALVYAGMILGGLPGLKLDRTGVALLGAIALLASGRLAPAEAVQALDVPTLGLLFGLMVLSAQLRLGGFYGFVTRRVATARLEPPALLLLLVLVAGVLSALLANDIVCLAMAPVLAEACLRRGLDPLPFLLGLACASNVGSAATLIGNPQNMLVGQVLGLPFGGYLARALVPSVLGLLVTWAVIARLYRGRWERPGTAVAVDAPPLDRWQAGKGLAILAALVLAFLVAPWPREIVALGAAGLVLLSRRLASRRMLGLVDWHLILLFVGLFVVHGALARSGMAARGLAALERAGVELERPAWLFATTVVLSNLVSNVPAVMLLLPAARHPDAGVILALASTFAGNLLLVGSIANLIVAEQAAHLGIRIRWRDHARVGIPVTLVTLALAALWLACF
jgi:Na+/H+ antiporter NhaD/arsenite permease-like protein